LHALGGFSNCSHHLGFVYLNTGDGFDNGKQWQANLGDNWKNRPTHENGENSMLIDINGLHALGGFSNCSHHLG
jgi:hypothetical protein